MIERASKGLRDFVTKTLPARRPHHGGAADVGVPLARRAAPGREGPRPVAHRAPAQPRLGRHAGVARTLHAADLRHRAASTWPGAWRAPTSGRSGARPSISTAAVCASRRLSSASTSRQARGATWRQPKPARRSRCAFSSAGQTGAGKSSLLNALANAVEAEVSVVPATARVTAYKLTHEGLPAALLIDSPGLADAELHRRLDSKAPPRPTWCCGSSSATRAAREIDRQALAAIRSISPPSPTGAGRRCCSCSRTSTAAPLQRMGPALRPDSRCLSAKAQSILGAMEAAGADLGFAPTRSCRCASTLRWRPTTSTPCGPRSSSWCPTRNARVCCGPWRHQECLGLGDDLVAGGQRGPRHRGHLPEPEHRRHEPHHQAGNTARRSAADPAPIIAQTVAPQRNGAAALLPIRSLGARQSRRPGRALRHRPAVVHLRCKPGHRARTARLGDRHHRAADRHLAAPPQGASRRRRGRGDAGPGGDDRRPAVLPVDAAHILAGPRHRAERAHQAEAADHEPAAGPARRGAQGAECQSRREVRSRR